MARRLGRRALLALLVLVPVAPARASQLPPCRRTGERIVRAGREWVCVRDGNRLVWRRAPAPLPTAPTPAPNATPSTPSSTPALAVGEVGPLDRIPDGTTSTWSVITSRGTAQDVFIVRRGANLTVLDSTCTHAGCMLAQWGAILRCGCHGAIFDATTGTNLNGPSSNLAPLRRLTADRRGDTVFVLGI